MSGGFIDKIIRRNRPKVDQQPVSSHIVDFKGSMSSHLSEGNIFLDGATILERPELKTLVIKIRETVEVSPEYFDSHYLPVLESCASYCQNAHASAGYHHAFPYGLITHLLEASLYALRKSRANLYNPTNSEGKVDDLKHVYAYVVFVAAMLHDIGKIITDVRFSIRSNDGRFVPWSPLSSLPPPESAKIEYRIDRKVRKSNQQNLYLNNSHQLASPALITNIVPKSSLQWIASFHPKVELDFLHAVSGDYGNANVIGVSVREGDQISTSKGKSNVQEISNPSDKNVKLRDVLIQTFMNPQTNGLIIKENGFRNYARVEDRIFVAGDALKVAIQNLCKGAGISLPDHTSTFEGMITDFLTIPAPSGDTMWWVQFAKKGEPRDKSKREIKCFVFDAKVFNPDHSIPNESVEIHLGDGSLSEEDLAARKKLETEELLSSSGVSVSPTVMMEEEDDSESSSAISKGESPKKQLKENENKKVIVESVDSKAKEQDSKKPKPKSKDKPQVNKDSLRGFLSSVEVVEDVKQNSNADESKPKHSDSKKVEVATSGQEGEIKKGTGDVIPPAQKVKRRKGRKSTFSDIDELGPNTSTVQHEKRKAEEVTQEDVVDTVTHTSNEVLPEVIVEDVMPEELDYTDYVLMSANDLLLMPNTPPTVSENEPGTYEGLGDTSFSSLAPSLHMKVINAPRWIESQNKPSIASINEMRELFRFLQQSLDAGSIRFNNKTSWLHKVEGGIFITTPRAFNSPSPLSVNKKFEHIIKNSNFLGRFMMDSKSADHNVVRAGLYKRDRKKDTYRFVDYLWGFYLLTDSHFRLHHNGKPLKSSMYCKVDEDSVKGLTHASTQ